MMLGLPARPVTMKVLRGRQLGPRSVHKEAKQQQQIRTNSNHVIGF